jgi:hypothetical protein
MLIYQAVAERGPVINIRVYPPSTNWNRMLTCYTHLSNAWAYSRNKQIDVVFFMARQPLRGLGLLIFRGFAITHFRHTTPGKTPLDEWPVRRRHLPDNTQHSQETDIHAPGGIRTHNPNKRAAADPRLRRRGYWDRLERCSGNGKT